MPTTKDYKRIILFNIFIYIFLFSLPMMLMNYVPTNEFFSNLRFILIFIFFYLSPVINAGFLTKCFYESDLAYSIKNNYLKFGVFFTIFLVSIFDFLFSHSIIFYEEVNFYIITFIFLKVVFYNLITLYQLKTWVLIILLTSILISAFLLSTYLNTVQYIFIESIIILIFVLSSHYNVYLLVQRLKLRGV